MYIIEISTGEMKTAQYITTKSGNKRMNVEGKTYTDKQFNKLFSVITDAKITVPLFRLVKEFKKSPEQIAIILMNTIFSHYDCSYQKGMLTVIIK